MPALDSLPAFQQELSQLAGLQSHSYSVWSRLHGSTEDENLRNAYRQQLECMAERSRLIREMLDKGFHKHSRAVSFKELDEMNREIDEMISMEGESSVRDTALSFLAQKLGRSLLSHCGKALSHSFRLGQHDARVQLKNAFQEQLSLQEAMQKAAGELMYGRQPAEAS